MPPTPVLSKADPQLMNTTSLRLLKLLRWLILSPCSLAMLQQYFLEDVDTQKKLSEDTIGLYLNTLRQMGCEIERPVKRNQHCYTLVRHPFKPTVDSQQLKALIQFKQHAEEHLPPLAILTLDDALATLLGEETMQALFTQSRALDYRPYKALIEELKDALGQGWVNLSYQSPKQGLTSFPFCLDDFLYDKGVLYAQGKRGDKPGDSRLRVERIVTLQSLQDIKAKSQAVSDQRLAPSSLSVQDLFTHHTQVTCYLSVEESGNLPKQHWQSTVALWQDCVAGSATIKPIAPCWILWSATVTDIFVLTQHLLQWPGVVQILSPAQFAMDWQKELCAMAALYGPLPEVSRRLEPSSLPIVSHVWSAPSVPE
ncbi:MAG: WYL domain-containing protein [Vampirovibrionales bacterium]|nr:WYL domain-containing protein [Vampirovibrionales bacterium]